MIGAAAPDEHHAFRRRRGAEEARLLERAQRSAVIRLYLREDLRDVGRRHKELVDAARYQACPNPATMSSVDADADRRPRYAIIFCEIEAPLSHGACPLLADEEQALLVRERLVEPRDVRLPRDRGR